jgi:MoxR-like ATPase
MRESTSRGDDTKQTSLSVKINERDALSGAKKLKKITTEMKKVIYGRDDIINTLSLMLASNQHCLIIGSHGEGKSMSVKKLVEGAGLFHYNIQVHNETIVKDVVGMIDPRAYQEGRLELLKTGFWDANILYFDEFMRGRTEFLDFLLEVMQERKTSKTVLGEVDLPLISVICTSNPLTDDYNTERMDAALKDRFSFIIDINHLMQNSPSEVLRVLNTHNENYSIKCEGLTINELTAIPKYAKETVEIDNNMIKDIFEILLKENFAFSTRFIKRFKECSQINAFMNSRTTANQIDIITVANMMLQNRFEGLTKSKINKAVKEAFALSEMTPLKTRLDKAENLKGIKFVAEWVDIMNTIGKVNFNSLPASMKNRINAMENKFGEEFGISTKEVSRDYELIKKMQNEYFREYLEDMAELRSLTTGYMSEADAMELIKKIAAISKSEDYFDIQMNTIPSADITGKNPKKRITIIPKVDNEKSFEKMKTIRVAAKQYLSKY